MLIDRVVHVESDSATLGLQNSFSGDTLSTLSQEITRADSTTTVLRAYRIDTSGCHWRRGA